MFGDDLVNAATQAQDFTRGDLDISRLTFRATEWLVDQNGGIRQAEAFAFLSGRQEDRAHAHRHAHTYRRDIWFDVLHGVIDGQACINAPTRRVDIHLDVFGGILALEVEQLCDGNIGNGVINRRADEDDALF